MKLVKMEEGLDKVDYYVSPCGRIFYKFKNSKLLRLKSSRIDKYGYEVVKIRGKHMFAHRIVAKYFISQKSQEDDLTVNHIDGNKRNNKSVNLEWLSRKDNSRYSIDVLQHKVFRKCVILHIVTNRVLNEFNCIEDAVKVYGTNMRESIQERPIKSNYIAVSKEDYNDSIKPIDIYIKRLNSSKKLYKNSGIGRRTYSEQVVNDIIYRRSNGDLLGVTLKEMEGITNINASTLRRILKGKYFSKYEKYKINCNNCYYEGILKIFV